MCIIIYIFISYITRIGNYEAMTQAYNELEVLLKKVDNREKEKGFIDVYHTCPKTPINEQKWSVGCIIPGSFKEKEKYEKVGLSVIKLPKAKGVTYNIININNSVRLPCKGVLCYCLNSKKMYY